MAFWPDLGVLFREKKKVFSSNIEEFGLSLMFTQCYWKLTLCATDSTNFRGVE